MYNILLFIILVTFTEDYIRGVADFHKQMMLLLQSVYPDISTIHLLKEYHISLSQTVPIMHHWIDPLSNAIADNFRNNHSRLVELVLCASAIMLYLILDFYMLSLQDLLCMIYYVWCVCIILSIGHIVVFVIRSIFIDLVSVLVVWCIMPMMIKQGKIGSM